MYADGSFIGRSLDSLAQRNEVQREVAEQTAALLRIAHMLRLTQLMVALHTVVFTMAACLLYGVLELVFTDAVHQALVMPGSNNTSKQDYIRHVLTHSCPFVDGIGEENLLQPIGLPTINPTTLALDFDAQLLRDFVDIFKGSIVHVSLDLFGTTSGCRRFSMTAVPVGTGRRMWYSWPLQLSLGSNVDDPAYLQQVMRCRLSP
jgi:hypothetical protein